MNKILNFILVLVTVSFFIGCVEKPKKDVPMKKIEKAIAKSDDYNKYKDAFLIKTKELVDAGRCTLSELKEFGGWMYAPIWSKKMGGRPCYFIYCGGSKVENRIYIDPLGFDKVE